MRLPIVGVFGVPLPRFFLPVPATESQFGIRGQRRNCCNQMTRMEGPDFICIGAQKAGTGWLYDQLREHPDFWMPPLKELHYFDRAGRSARETRSGSVDRIGEARRSARDGRDLHFLAVMEQLRSEPVIRFDGYAALFGAKESLLSGDITPGYSTLDQQLIQRITERFPKTKVIFFARDPVERAWSQLSMWVRHGVLLRSDISNDTIIDQLQRPELTARSFPSQIVSHWRQFVREDLLRVFFFDDLSRDAAGTRKDVIDFLGGDPAKPSGKLAAGYNPKGRKEKLPMSAELRETLAGFFREELKACAAQLGGPARTWPARYGF
jgi:hypothetical protein